MTLQQLQSSIAYLFPSAAPNVSYTTVVDSTGNATIALWNNALGAQPTTAQLTSALATVELAPSKAAQITTLDSSYQTARYNTPVTITSTTKASWVFPTDASTQTSIMGYLAAFDASDWPSAGLPLQDSSGTVQTTQYADVKAIAQAIANQSVAVWQKLQTLIAQVNAATTVAAVQAIVW